MEKIGIINYGAGNYKSVYNALEYLNVNFVGICKPSELKGVTHIILPGVGAFKAVFDQLEKLGFIEALKNEVLYLRKFFLGICVGMQILATIGTEFEDSIGLNYIPGKVVAIGAGKFNLPVPHIGWNEVTIHRHSLLFNDIENDASFYFVHGFHFVPESSEHLISTCLYGSRLTASVEKENIFGVQFHPEKSQLNGLQLLKNFASLS